MRINPASDGVVTTMDPAALRLVILIAALAASGAIALLLRGRDGRVREVTGAPAITSADVGRPLGTTAAFVQFSARTCAPCRTVRRALEALTVDRPDLVHIDVDAEERLDLARRHGVLRTPTVLVLDGGGQVLRRFSGVPGDDLLRTTLTDLRALPSPAEVPDGSPQA